MDDFKRILALGLALLGIAGNLLLLVALGRTKRGWHRLNLQLVGPIAGADFLATLLIAVSTVLSFAIGNREVLTSEWYCASFGVFLQTLPVFSVLLLAAMSVDRYRLVVHGRGVSCRWGWLAIAAACLGVAAMKMANSAVHGLRPDPTETYCQTFGSATLTKANQHISNFIFLGGVAVISFSYLAIYVHCRRNPVAFHALPRGYILILAAYITCLLPKFVTSLLRLFIDKDALPHFLILLAPLGFNLLFFANPCLVFAFQASLRKELYSLFSSQPCDKIQLTSESFDKPYAVV